MAIGFADSERDVMTLIFFLFQGKINIYINNRKLFTKYEQMDLDDDGGFNENLSGGQNGAFYVNTCMADRIGT